MNQESQDVNALILSAPDEAQGRMTFKQISWVGRVMYASGMFKNTQTEAQAVVKIMAGSEMGMSPFQSMNGIDIIEGQAVVKPHTIASRIKQTGKYDFRVKTLTAVRCDIDFYQIKDESMKEKKSREHLGTATFTIEQAQTAGLVDPQCKPNPQTNTIDHDLRTVKRFKRGGGSFEKYNSCLCKDNWKNYPDDMLYARTMSRGSKRYTPDVFSIPIYTTDEIDEQQEEERKKAESGEPEFDYLPSGENKQLADQNQQVEDPPEDDDTDLPEEPDQESTAGITPDDEEGKAEEAASVDEQFKPLIPVDDEFKQSVQDDMRDLELAQNERLRLLRKTTGSISIKGIKNDHQWRSLREAVDQLMTEVTSEDKEDSDNVA